MNIKQTSEIKNIKRDDNIKPIKVGIINPCYGYERVSYALKLSQIEYKRLFTLPLYRVFKCYSQFFKFTPIVFGFGVSLLHTWNSLPISRKPFVVSFECELPRYLGRILPWQMSFGRKLLSSPRCRRILALSEAAQNKFMLDCEKTGDIELIKKTTVFRGGVDLSISAKKDYSMSGTLKLLFVGTDAVRKGIVPLYRACEKLIEQGIDVKLTFIGGFNDCCYVYGEHIPDVNALEAELKATKWIDYQGRVPVLEVLTQMKSHDVLVFPTFDESLGWVPIEAGLLGVPSIATDIFAIPELVEHEKTGYLISINKRRDRRFVGLDTFSSEQYQYINEAEKKIEIELITAIRYLYENREIIEKWGRKAKIKLEKMYSPQIAESQLSKIYELALK